MVAVEAKEFVSALRKTRKARYPFIALVPLCVIDRKRRQLKNYLKGRLETLPSYSGDTCTSIYFSAVPSAETSCYQGASYGKTNIKKLTPSTGSVCVRLLSTVYKQKLRLGQPQLLLGATLVSNTADVEIYSVTYVKQKGRRLLSQVGFIAKSGKVSYLANTKEDALKILTIKKEKNV